MFKLGEMAKISLDSKIDPSDRGFGMGKYVPRDKDENGNYQSKAIQMAFHYWPAFQAERSKFEELDDYVGLSGHNNINKHSIKVMFDTGTETIKKGDVIDYDKNDEVQKALWNEIENRNEVELCKKAQEEFDAVSGEYYKALTEWGKWFTSPNRNKEENPFKRIAKMITDNARAGKTLHMDYLFLQSCNQTYSTAFGAGDSMDIVKKGGFFRKRFEIKTGIPESSDDDLWLEIFQLSYLSFLYGKDVAGAINGNVTYSYQQDNRGALFDRKNRNSNITIIVDQYKKHPFSEVERFIAKIPAANMDELNASGKRRTINRDTNEYYNKYAIDVAKGKFTVDEVKDIIRDDLVEMGIDEDLIDDKVSKEMESFSKDLEAAKKLFTSKDLSTVISVTANHAGSEFRNTKRNIMQLPSLNDIPKEVRRWLNDERAYAEKLGTSNEKITDPEKLAELEKYYKIGKERLQRVFDETYGYKSLDSNIKGKDGDDSTTVGENTADTRNFNGVDSDIVEQIDDAMDDIVKTLKSIHPINPGMFYLIVNYLKYPFLTVTNLQTLCPYISRVDRGRMAPKVKSSSGLWSMAYGDWSNGERLGLGDMAFVSSLQTIINNFEILDLNTSLANRYYELIDNTLPNLYKQIYKEDFIDVTKPSYTDDKGESYEYIIGGNEFNLSLNSGLKRQVSRDFVNIKDRSNSDTWKQFAPTDMDKTYRWLNTEKSIKNGDVKRSAQGNVLASRGKSMVSHKAGEIDEALFIDIYNAALERM